MNTEQEIISNLINTGEFNIVKELDLKPSEFRTEEGKETFLWIWKQVKDPKQDGSVPKADRVVRKFPTFDYSPTKESIEGLICDLRELHLKLDINTVLDEMADLIIDNADPQDILVESLRKLKKLEIKSSDIDGLYLDKTAADMLKNEYETKSECGGIDGIPYPWEPLNKATGGMHPEEFIVVYGRPKNMKTWIATAILSCAYEFNSRVLIYSKEMSREGMLRRMVSILARLPYSKIKEATLEDSDLEIYYDFLDSLEQSEDDPDKSRRAMCFISDKGRKRSSSVGTIEAVAEKFRPDVILVDGFYLMSDQRSKQRNADWKSIAHISQDLKALAQYLNCTVVGTTQANRSGAQKVSSDLDDLSFADSVGMDADLLMRVWRGPNPSGEGASVAISFPGVRDALLRAFVVNANPGIDFSLQKSKVDMRQFLKDKERWDSNSGDDESAGGFTPNDPHTIKRKRKIPKGYKP